MIRLLVGVNRQHVDTGRVLETGIITIAVGLVVWLVLTVLPNVHPVKQWFSSDHTRKGRPIRLVHLLNLSALYTFGPLWR